MMPPKEVVSFSSASRKDLRLRITGYFLSLLDGDAAEGPRFSGVHPWWREQGEEEVPATTTVGREGHEDLSLLNLSSELR
jgi:hypothetical protein